MLCITWQMAGKTSSLPGRPEEMEEINFEYPSNFDVLDLQSFHLGTFSSQNMMEPRRHGVDRVSS